MDKFMGSSFEDDDSSDLNRIDKMFFKFAGFMGIIFFFVFIYLTFKATYYLLRRINKLNLKSDLNIWLLKLLAGIIDVIVLFFLFTGTFVFVMSNAFNLSYFVIIINSILVLIISTFMLFRFNRRHEMIGI